MGDEVVMKPSPPLQTLGRGLTSLPERCPRGVERSLQGAAISAQHRDRASVLTALRVSAEEDQQVLGEFLEDRGTLVIVVAAGDWAPGSEDLEARRSRHRSHWCSLLPQSVSSRVEKGGRLG